METDCARRFGEHSRWARRTPDQERCPRPRGVESFVNVSSSTVRNHHPTPESPLDLPASVATEMTGELFQLPGLPTTVTGVSFVFLDIANGRYCSPGESTGTDSLKLRRDVDVEVSTDPRPSGRTLLFLFRFQGLSIVNAIGYHSTDHQPD